MSQTASVPPYINTVMKLILCSPVYRPVILRLRGSEVQGWSEVFAEDKQSVAKALAQHLRRVPSDARYYEVTFDARRNPRANEFGRGAQNTMMIRITLCGEVRRDC